MDSLYDLGDLKFTWDPQKYRSNVLKYGITFEEAATTWLDPDALERLDEEHSPHEDRWLRIGYSVRGALLVTWSVIRTHEGKEAIRIIGARRATRKEWRLYEAQRL